jgi:hypothetical protein
MLSGLRHQECRGVCRAFASRLVVGDVEIQRISVGASGANESCARGVEAQSHRPRRGGFPDRDVGFSPLDY